MTSLSAIAVSIALISGLSASGERSGQFLEPSPAIGDVLQTVFSKTIAIEGQGFDPVVRRVSGSATDRITAVNRGDIVEDEQYRYDGMPPGSSAVRILDGGRTNCVDGACHFNDQTSAALFNPLLWGRIPARLTVGSTWQAAVAAPWEIGPAGAQTITVERLEPPIGMVTLQRRGEGAGSSSDDKRAKPISVVVGGNATRVRLVPGRATWTGRATIIRGVTIADEIVVDRGVQLVKDDGSSMVAHERIYTILTEAG